MFLWTVLLLVLGSYQDVRLKQGVFVSDEMCGNLRHIGSNTCVGAKEDQHILIANEASPCSESHLFCLNTTTQIITQESSQSKVGIVVGDPEGDILKLMTNDCTSESTHCKWRLKERGKIQQGTSDGACWQRNEVDGQITIATCNTPPGSPGPGNQQFDFQIRRESENSGNLLLI